MSEVEDLLKRCERAKTRRQKWDGELKDAYRLAAPNRDSGFQSLTAGEDRSDDRFDDSLMLATRDAAKLMYATITPPHSRFCKLEPGSDLEDELRRFGGDAAVKEGQSALADITDRFFRELDESNFYREVGQAYRQQQISTGVLFFHEKPRREESAFRFECVPLHQIYPERGPNGVVETVWQEPVVEARHVALRWPDARLTGEIQRQAKESPDREVRLVEGVVHDDRKDDYRYLVIDPTEKAVLVERRLNTSPWILFSSDTAPGEAIGRGPVLDVLADGRTADRVVELLLQNASIAVTGIWQADDDGVLNPATVQLTPGAIIPKAVGSAGLQPLNQAWRFDMSQFVLEDIRARNRYAVFGPELPPMGQAGNMTATETERRVQEANLLRAPEMMRVWRELVVPLVRRGVDILKRRGVVPDIQIGRKITNVIPTSPLARMQRMAEVLDATQVRAMVMQNLGPEVAELVMPSEELAVWIAEQGGYPVHLIRDRRGRQQAKQQAAMAQAAQLAAQNPEAAAQLAGAVMGGQ